MDNSIQQKICGICQQPRAVTEFSPCRSGTFGVHTYCRPCYNLKRNPAAEPPPRIDPITGEEWRPVLGYEGWYEASNNGRVRRIRAGKAARVGRILRPIAPTKTLKYFSMVLYKNRQPSRFLVHQIVAAAFHGPCPEGKEVNHIDGDKSNNRPDNFEYLSHAENIRHAMNLGLYPTPEQRSETMKRCAARGDNHYKRKRMLI